MRHWASGLVALALLGVVSGCSQQTVESATKDAKRNAEYVEKEAKPGLQKLNLGGRATAALKLNRKLPSTIRVDADVDGIRLRGKVRTQEEKELAEKVARDTLPEKATLRNELVVTGSDKEKDTEKK